MLESKLMILGTDVVKVGQKRVHFDSLTNQCRLSLSHKCTGKEMLYGC